MRTISIGFVLAALVAVGCSKKKDDQPAPAPEQPATKVTAGQPAQPAADSPTLDQVVAKHLAALGGADKWKALETMTFTVKGDKGATTIQRKRPNLMRAAGSKDGKEFVKVFDGTAGYYKHGDETKHMTGDKAKGMAEHARFDDALMTYKELGLKVELAGTADVDGNKAYKIVLHHDGGKPEVRYLDATSYFEVKREMSWEKDGETKSTVYYFTDYKPVNGLQINHGLVVEADGKKMEHQIVDIGLDTEMPDDLFKIPGDA